MQAAYPGVAMPLNGTAVLLLANAVKDLLFGILAMLLIFGPKVTLLAPNTPPPSPSPPPSPLIILATCCLQLFGIHVGESFNGQQWLFQRQKQAQAQGTVLLPLALSDSIDQS